MDEEHPIPAVVAKVGNNGVMYYVGKNDYEITSNKIVIIADGAVASGLVYYHEKEFTILHNAYAIELKQKEFAKKENYLFLATVIQKSIFEAFTYEFKPTWNKVKQEFISLPVLPSCNENKFEIAFEYMESYIKELEAERLEELEAYLLATGLKDYKLIEQEKVILQDFAKLQNEDSKRGGHLVA